MEQMGAEGTHVDGSSVILDGLIGRDDTFLYDIDVPPHLGLCHGIHKRECKVEEFTDDPRDGEQDGRAEAFGVKVLEDADELFRHAGRRRGGFLSGKVDDEDEVARGKVLVVLGGDGRRRELLSVERFLLSNLA